MEANDYVRMAEAAGAEGAHVAAVMYYRTAAEAAASGAEVRPILEAVLDYAATLKKPMDQLALYEWGQQVIAAKELQGSGLEQRVQQALEKTQQEVGKNETA